MRRQEERVRRTLEVRRRSNIRSQDLGGRRRRLHRRLVGGDKE